MPRENMQSLSSNVPIYFRKPTLPTPSTVIPANLASNKSLLTPTELEDVFGIG